MTSEDSQYTYKICLIDLWLKTVKKQDMVLEIKEGDIEIRIGDTLNGEEKKWEGCRGEVIINGNGRGTQRKEKNVF